MMRKPEPGIKFPYFKADQYPETDETTCVEIRVPAHPAFLPQLAGLVAIATKAFNYQGEDFEHIRKLSLMWKNAYNETDWGQCMNCEEMTACMTPLLEDFRAQIVQDITSKQYGTNFPTGEPLPDEERTRNLAAGSNPTCDMAILYNQCAEIIEYTVKTAQDALDLAESATNDTELVAVIMELPILDEMGGDAIASYIAFFQEGIVDNYEAQITEEYKELATCALFCLCRDDCEITLDRWQKVFRDRVEEHFDTPMGTFSTIADLFAYFIDQDIDGTIIADALNFLVCEGGILTNQFLGDVGTKALETLINLAKNSPNPDWEILCEECPTFSRLFDLTGTDATYFTIPDCNISQGGAFWEEGIGFIRNASSGGGCDQLIRLTIPVDRTITKVVFTFASAIPSETFDPDTHYQMSANASNWGDPIQTLLFDYEPVTGDPTAFTWEDTPAFAPGVNMQIAYDADIGEMMPDTIILVSILIEGEGSMPSGW